MNRTSAYFEYRTDDQQQGYLAVRLRGIALLRLTATNKGTAFTHAERRALGLEGLLPDAVLTLDEQVKRLYSGFQRQVDDLEKYRYLRNVQDRNEVAFFALLERHLEEMMPIVYTPTVGKAVQQFSALYQQSRGLILSPAHMGHLDECLANYPWEDVRTIVVTDASAILGIGDQGVGGLSICVGKLALYSAGGGISPFHTMPVSLDVGTNAKHLLEDSDYLGSRQSRLQGEAYFKFLDRFVEAVQKRWPKAVIQWEDFAKSVAFAVLDRYRDQIASFNDDIQGTGAVVLAGLLSACKLKGEALTEQKIVIAGAGAAGIGVARAIVAGMMREGLSEQEARARLFVVDIDGLVVAGLNGEPYMQSVAQQPENFAKWHLEGEIPCLSEVINNAGATVLMGFTGKAGLFTEQIIRRLQMNTARPVVFALSNPNANCEAHPQDVANWTEGDAIIATGSPFPTVLFNDQEVRVGQGNNAFVFPGIGFATVLGKCQKITEGMILESAYALADYNADHYLAKGMIYPPVSALREVSECVTARVLGQAIKEGVSTRTELAEVDLQAYVQSRSWHANYLPFVAADLNPES